MKPTPKQLAFLRSLADRTGQTFTYPETREHASREIRRLKATRPTSRSERVREKREVQRDLAERPDDSTAMRDDDVQGYGSTARWAHTRDQGGRR